MPVSFLSAVSPYTQFCILNICLSISISRRRPSGSRSFAYLPFKRLPPVCRLKRPMLLVLLVPLHSIAPQFFFRPLLPFPFPHCINYPRLFAIFSLPSKSPQQSYSLSRIHPFLFNLKLFIYLCFNFNLFLIVFFSFSLINSVASQ